MKLRTSLCLAMVASLLCSCSLGGLSMLSEKSDDGTALADAKMDLLLRAIESCNTDDLLTLFAPNALAEAENMNAMISQLYAYCPATFDNYDNLDALDTETDWEYGARVTRLYATYDVESSNGKYRFAFLYVSHDSQCAENIGLWSVYVIDWDEDTDTDFAYRGDHLYTPGIHIGVKNSVPQEDS